MKITLIAMLTLSLALNLMLSTSLINIRKSVKKVGASLFSTLSLIGIKLSADATVIRRFSADYQEFKSPIHYPRLAEDAAKWMEESGKDIKALAQVARGISNDELRAGKV